MSEEPTVISREFMDHIRRRYFPEVYGMDYEIMRLECLKLATSQGFKGADAIKEAERMMAYCRERGTIDKLTDMAVKARVVGRDGDFEKPFKDYLTKRDD